MSSAKTLIVITGPTAVGKTALCLDIAQHFGIPIINADSRQIYKELKIGTASPTDDQLAKVKHYFVGSLSLNDYYSASLFEQQTMEILEREFAKSDYALMAGGLEPLVEELKQLDPEYYEIVDKQNPRRVVHGLEICLMTGKTYTSFRKREKKQRPFRIIKIGLNRDREELYDRINQRVDQMMDEGLLDEARNLYPMRHMNALNTVGYKEMFAYLDGTWTLEEAR